MNLCRASLLNKIIQNKEEVSELIYTMESLKNIRKIQNPRQEDEEKLKKYLDGWI